MASLVSFPPPIPLQKRRFTRLLLLLAKVQNPLAKGYLSVTCSCLGDSQAVRPLCCAAWCA